MEELKTSFMGYDKEAVLLYIKELIGQLEEENEARQKELYLEKTQLSAENRRLQEEQATQQKIYAQLSERIEQMAGAMEKSEGYARERDKALARFQTREKELLELEETAKDKAQEILREAETQGKELLEKAQGQSKKILEGAAASKEQILLKAQEQVEEFIFQAREETRRQKELYEWYRGQLRNYQESLAALLEQGEKEPSDVSQQTLCP